MTLLLLCALRAAGRCAHRLGAETARQQRTATSGRCHLPRPRGRPEQRIKAPSQNQYRRRLCQRLGESPGLARTASSRRDGGVSTSAAAPLAERPAEETASLRDLLDWYRQQAGELANVASRLRSIEDGWPTEEDLQVELTWVMEDAVAGYGESSTESSWRMLKMELRRPWGSLLDSGDDIPDIVVSLRTSLTDLQSLWHRRVKDRVPVQYLLGGCHWRDFVLAVGPGCLIPRPETELLVEFAEAALREDPSLANSPWADIGTGSGALAVALGDLLRTLGTTPPSVWAVDTSEDAAAWARLNAERQGLGEVVKVVVGSWYEPLQPVAGQLAGILSNPPYIPSWKLEDLQAEVSQHEPLLALDGGKGDGMESINSVITGAYHALRPGGFLALETEGGHQTAEIVQMLAAASPPLAIPAGSFTNVTVRKDYRGVARFITCSKTS